MNKTLFGKNWNWYTQVESSEDITDAHINIVYKNDLFNNKSFINCKKNDCKINCSQNPLCLNGLGEKKLMGILTNTNKQIKLNKVDPNEYFRKDAYEHAGLVNLGATCYINTYLQVWFNNTHFREIILETQFNTHKSSPAPLYTNERDDDTHIPKFNIQPYDNIATNLKLIFTLLKYSIRKSIDPNFFIKALQLDENMQQDAQEFSQLFLNKLTTCLPLSTNGHIINSLFEGEYSYVTQCDNCKFESTSNSSFLELTLNIQNSTNIQECLNKMLKAEILDGDNQYNCSHCYKKQNAKRFMHLKRLPPILNLQLLRFVYDRHSGCKKKLQTKIKFNEILDLSEYVTHEANVCLEYHLGAILMHVGKTAYSGHYMAQIKNFEKNEWYSYNDEQITKVGNKSKLGTNSDEQNEATDPNTSNDKVTRKQSESSNKSSSHLLSSPNAYLLVYYRKYLFGNQAGNKNDQELKTNDEQFKLVNDDNTRLKKWFDKLKQKNDQLKETKLNETQIIKNAYDSLWFSTTLNDQSNDHYFMSIEFIKKWLSLQTMNLRQTPELLKILQNTKKYLCPHNKLNPFALNKFKIVSKQGCDLLGEHIEFNDLNLFDINSMKTTKCMDCVKNIFNYLRLRDQIKDDTKVYKQLLKNIDGLDLNSDANSHQTTNTSTTDVIPLNNEINVENKLYWIGKESLKTWSSLAIKQIQLKLPSNRFNAIFSNDDDDDEVTLLENDENQAASPNETELNDDLTLLNTITFNDEIKCKHGNLSATSNKRLVTQDLVNFLSKYFPSIEFTSGNTQECEICVSKNEFDKQLNVKIKSQKDILLDLYSNRNRPSLSNLKNGELVNLVSSSFVKEWRNCVRTSKAKHIRIENGVLLCDEHKRLTFNELTLDDTQVVLLTDNEWSFLSNNFEHDMQIKVKKNDTNVYLFEPEICDFCLRVKELERFVFKRKRIYIRLIEPNYEHNHKGQNIVQCDDSSSSADCPTKKQKISNDVCEITSEKDESMSGRERMDVLPGAKRRSRRAKKSKNDFSIMVSSNETIKEIKLKIAVKLGTMLSEQHLYFNQIELDNDKEVLNYKINPNDLLILKIDKQSNDDLDLMIHESVRGPEIGFRGTNLLSF